MRPIDLAREHGLSAQAVRNYGNAGVLPRVERGDGGHRRYTELHAQALRAFLALRRGHGHQRAVEIMRAVHRGDLDTGYRLLDAAHLELHAERAARGDAANALGQLSASAAATTAGPPLTVGELAHRIGVHPATLRTWESAGVLRPERDRTTGYRHYGPSCVRDAEIARQLRRGGYRLAQVAQFLESLRAAGGADALRAFLDAWQQRLSDRGRALMAGAGQLDRYLTLLAAQTRG